jgi:predicted transcriptional regulator
MFTIIAQIASFILLLLGTFTFGLLGKTTEMGLCILAGAISLAFTNIDKISKFKGAGFEAEMREKAVDAIIAKEAEPEQNETGLIFSLKSYGLDENTRQVVNALGNSKYTWRTLSGIAKESGLSKNAIKESVNWLMLNGLVIQAGSKIYANWGLSEDGRNLYNHISASTGANA